MIDIFDTASIKQSLVSAYAHIEILENRFKEIMNNAPKKDQKPTKEITNIVSKMSPKTFGDNYSFWVRMLKSGTEDHVLLWKNGSVTNYGTNNTKNPIAVFSSRHKARNVLRKAGWDVPFAIQGKDKGRYILVTRK